MTLHARKTTFDFSATPPHWLAGDAQSTHTVNVGHLLFPSGERFFIDAVRNALPYVTDERIRKDIQGFIGQEGTHSNQHDRCIEHMASYGIDVRRQMAGAEVARERLNSTINALPEPFRKQAVIETLAITAAAEHVTAYLGDFILNHTDWDELDIDPDMKHLLRWHAAEEIEHRHVAFDVLHHIDRSYFRRIAPIGPIGFIMTIGWAGLAARLMQADPTTGDRWSWRHHLKTARERRMVSIPSMIWDLRIYLQPGHHPSKLPGSVEGAVTYLRTAPSVVTRMAS